MTAVAGLGPILGLVLRRDRVRLALWVGGVVGVVLVSAASLQATYPDQAAIDSYAALMRDNPALVAFAGPSYGFDDPNIGVILVNEGQLWGCITLALMSIFLINRHTRAEEDVERAELLRSGVTGRHTLTAAAVVVVGATNLVIAAACAAGFVALGYEPAGSLAMGGAYLAAGWLFLGLTVVVAQVAGSGRATLGLASGLLAVAFVLRAVGDAGGSGIRWLSPIAWAQSVRAFAGERWWVLGLCLVVAVAQVVAGFWLSTRRDLGAGLLPPGRGAERAGRWLTHPLGFAGYQHRGVVVGWVVAMFVVAALYASIGDDIQQMVEDNPLYADLLIQLGEADVTASYFATAMTMMAIMGAGFALTAVLRMRTEEAAGRVEPILATPTSRRSWMAGHLAVAGVGSVAVMGAAGSGAGMAAALVFGDAAQVGTLVGAALVTVPAVLVLAGVAAALFGWWPEAVPAAWGCLAVAAVIGVLGEVLRLPRWVRSVSPFEHVPRVPAEDVAWLPLVVLSVLAVGLVALGVAGFTRRDLRLS